MKEDFWERLRLLRSEYMTLITDKDRKFLEHKRVESFFPDYRDDITKLFKDYPKFEIEGVECLAGFTEDDLPFRKELLQAKLFQELICKDFILLPRYIKRTFAAVFDINLEKGSLGDGLVAISGDKYIEFKLCSSKKLAQRITSASKNSDLFFICVEDLDSPSLEKIKSGRIKIDITEGKKGYVWGLDNNLLLEINKNKENPKALPLFNWLPERIRGGRTDDCSSPTAIKVYSDKLLAVKQNELIPFCEYRSIESNYWKVDTVLLYGGDPSMTLCKEEYKKVYKVFSDLNVRAIIPKALPLEYFDDFPLTHVCMFSSQTNTRLDYDVSASLFAHRHGLILIKAPSMEPSDLRTFIEHEFLNPVNKIRDNKRHRS